MSIDFGDKKGDPFLNPLTKKRTSRVSRDTASKLTERDDSMPEFLKAKSISLNPRTDSQQSIKMYSQNDYSDYKKDKNGLPSSLKKKPFYLRGFLKEQNLPIKQLNDKSKVTLKEADKFFDDEDEKHKVKIMIKEFMAPTN